MIYKSYRIVDGRPRWVITDENGKIINRDPGKEDLKNIEIEKIKLGVPKTNSDNELLDYLRIFYKETKRIPCQSDFSNPEYPYYTTYHNRFGNWNKALKLAGLDIDTIVKQGNFQNNQHKGRLFEIFVMEQFKDNKYIDLSGNNHNSPCDGICPNKMTCEAKSAGLLRKKGWNFRIKNKLDIDWYYLGAFNKDFSKLMHVWRVPCEIIENDIYIGAYYGHFNIENMKGYEITEKFLANLKSKGLIFN